MKINLVRVLAGIILCSMSSCDRFSEQDYQLVIINASLYNTNTLEIEENKSIFIQNGQIEKISETNTSDIALKNVLDAQQKLLTPSFIDVHNHLNFIFGDTVETINPENFQYSRELLTEQYMPFGVTVVRSAGGREQHIPMEQSWMKHHPGYVDYYPAGGALVSLDTKFYNHQYVKDSSDVVSKIEEYYDMGIRHIKIYSLIEEQELRAAIQKTTELNMNVFGHIENSMISIESACENGLVNFEHAKTLFLEVIRKYENTSKDLSKL